MANGNAVDAQVTLDSILCTDELKRRPSRLPDYESENRALVALAQALADSPRTVLQALADAITQVLQVGSAGINLLTKEDGGKRFYWPAAAGMWKPHIGGSTPRDFGPCGVVLDRNDVQLFVRPQRYYPYLSPVTPPIHECLLAPFYIGGKATGAVWAVAHDDRRKFDAEDRRRLISLSRFASSAYQAVTFRETLEEGLRQRHELQFQLAFTAVKIGLPKIIGHGSKNSGQIAQATGLDERRLRRVLRGLVWAGIITLDEKEFYTLTASGAGLMRDDPLSPARGIRFQGEFFCKAWTSLHEYLVTGRIPFNHAHGIELFDLLDRDEELAKLYSATMTARLSGNFGAVAQLPIFDAAESVVDVGGAQGELLLDIVQARPRIRGIVFDRPVLQRSADELIHRRGLSDRCRFMAGDMFDGVPHGAGIYILKWILHDWDDERAAAILQSCAKAMTGASRLLILERLMPRRITGSTAIVQADLNMLCCTGGAERTLDEYRALLRQAGMELISSNQVENFSGFFALEARLAQA